MSNTVAELRAIIEPESFAKALVELYDTWRTQRSVWQAEQREKRAYLFATDTSTTSNAITDWKNKTTLPKLTQIRDNLHANYMSALFPNDDWMKWEAFDEGSAAKEKREAIQAYISNKIRLSSFKRTISQLLYDYIDSGNCFCNVKWVNDTVENDEGEQTVNYIGPVLERISTNDIVFNPTAVSFASSPKIVRKLVSIGELKSNIQKNPTDKTWIKEALSKIINIRKGLTGINSDDFDKAVSYSIDGFGSLFEYYGSNLVEILEFRGDIHDPFTGNLLKDHIITIVDRTHVVRKQKNPSWLGSGYMYHSGWRLRPDNIYAMGPLDNLVGLQYRIDHLENLKADVFDLIAFPPLKITGEVEEFEWKPLEKIFIDEGGNVEMLVPDTTALNADLQIARLEQQMEEFAGSPRETMGFRTPGEKTAFEVQSLITAAGRIFQEKITQFEEDIIEPVLNAMLELSRRNLDVSDVIRVLDPDIGIEDFISISKEDIVAKGKLRATGAKHFIAQAQIVQNLTNLANTRIWDEIRPHLSGKQLAKVIEDTLGLDRLDLFKENINIAEQGETARLAQQIQQDVELEGEISEEVPDNV